MPTTTRTACVLALPIALMTLHGCTLLDASQPGNLAAPTVDDDPSLPALEVNGTRLHVVKLGPDGAPVILLLHGGPGGDFRYMLPLADPTVQGALVADHQLVFWDQRGTGLSRRHPPGEVTMDRYQADLDALVEQVSPGAPVVLVGHSWGGAYAASYVARHPERVRGAVLIDPEALDHALYEAHGSALDADALAEWLEDPLWAREIVTPEDHARADFLLGSLELYRIPRLGTHGTTPQFRPGSVVFKYLDYQWFSQNDYDFTAGLSAFARPVWILAGTDDHVLGYDFQRQQAPLFRDATLVALPGDGHNDPVMGSAPRTIGYVRQYLGLVEGAP
jgi:proline iminopeptidase